MLSSSVSGTQTETESRTLFFPLHQLVDGDFSVFAVTEGWNNWAVFYPLAQICAPEGSTVEIKSSYYYPKEEGGRALSVVDRLWFISLENQQPLDLRTLPQFAGRVESSCQHNSCSLRIRALRRNDSAVYKFRITTNVESGRFTGEPGVTLRVTGKTLQPDFQPRLEERTKE